MRLSHLIAASAAAFFAVAGAANAATTVSSGYVDAQYAHVSGDDSGDANAWGIGGAWAAPLGETWGFQLNANWTDVSPDVGDDNNVLSGTGHVFHRTDKNLIGGFAGVSHSDASDSTVWGAGVEDDYYLSNTTLGLRGAYLRDDDFDVDAWGVEGHARFFPSDNIRLEASVGYAKVNFNPDDENVWNVGVEGEYQFASLPVSAFVGVGVSRFDNDFNDDDATTVSVGVRWNFGGQTLKDRDRSGASLPNIDRALGNFATSGLF